MVSNPIQELCFNGRKYYLSYGSLCYGSYDSDGYIHYVPVSNEVITGILLGLLNQIESED
jgi:hypothetical protein